MMRRHLLFLVALLPLACGNELTSPTSLNSRSNPPDDLTFTMRGEVRDTTNLPISGALVQVVAPSGTVAVTDANGEFVLPWPFSRTVTVKTGWGAGVPLEAPLMLNKTDDIPSSLRATALNTQCPCR